MDAVSFLYDFFFSYTGMACMGLIVALFVGIVLCHSVNLNPLKLLPALFSSAVTVYVFAKAFGVLSLACYRFNAGRALDWTIVPNAGIVFYGGLLGYFLHIRFLLPKLFRKDALSSAYGIATLLVPLFHGFARIGCYCAGCCYGQISYSGFWSAFHGGRVPVQLIECAFELVLFYVLCVKFVNYRWIRRTLYTRYLAAYSVFRFFIEFYRGDELRGFLGSLSFSQWIALAILAGLEIRKLVRMRRRKKKEAAHAKR